MKRVFILGAGFSKPAGMPLATELLPHLVEKLELEEMRSWLDGLRKRLAWLSGEREQTGRNLNIEEVFHYAHFDVEVFRLGHQLAQVGRHDGGTPWNEAESIESWLRKLGWALVDVILENDQESTLAPITQWARSLNERDAVLTFNYDTLVERALTELREPWSHGFESEANNRIRVFKLHGSVDWIVAHRLDQRRGNTLLFEKQNVNNPGPRTGHREEDYRLWRCPRDQLAQRIANRDVQYIPEEAESWTVGIAGLGAYKPLHQVPGLGPTWVHGMRALHEADLAVVVGFSLSDFDAMAQMQFAEIARDRKRADGSLRVIVIDPFIDRAAEDRFRRVFRDVEFVKQHHEEFDWRALC